MNIGSSYINGIKNNYNKDLCTGDILGDIGATCATTKKKKKMQTVVQDQQ